MNIRQTERAQPWPHALHVVVLGGLALAQPVFNLLSQYAQFLVAHQVGPLEVLLLVLLLTFLIPGAVVAGEHLLTLLIGSKGWLQGAGIAVFAFPLFLLFLKRITGVPGTLLVTIAVLLMLLSAFAYLRYRPVRLFLTILSPAILIIPTLFVTAPAIYGIVFPGRPGSTALESGKADVPIVMVIFDELPLRSLLDRSGNIDSGRFPNFAALANDATWFRNARTVSEATQYATPAILTGIYPKVDQRRVATYSDYPENLFTWLRNSHHLNIFESTTRLWPSRHESEATTSQKMIPLLEDLSVVYLHLVLPDDFSVLLPDVRHTWTGFLNSDRVAKGRPDDPRHQFETFLETLKERPNPSFNFVHLQIPHLPWIYLPSGKRYARHNDSPLFLKSEVWVQDEALVTLAFQRHLLQLGLTDRFVGRLQQKLKASGLYDRSLVVIVSDHGASFRPGGRRRMATEANFREILSVPLIIKAPYQEKGQVSDQYVETIDIVPTVANILGVRVPWPTDGVSAMGTGNRGQSDRSTSGSERTAPPFKNFTLFHPTTVCLEGAALAVIQEGAWVYLDAVREEADKVSFFGWAADIKTHRAADAILVFVDGKLIYRGATGYPRVDVAKHFGVAGMKDSGFLFEVDRELLQGDPEVRCFALFRDRASEVSYPEDFRWLPKSKRHIFGGCPPARGETCSFDKKTSRSYLITRSCSPETRLAGRPSGEFVTRLYDLAWDADENGLFKIGPSHSLVGRQLGELHVAEQKGLSMGLSQPSLYDEVRLDGEFIPAAIEGWVSAKGVVESVAVAVNGTIRAVASTFEGEGGGPRHFLAIVPEESFLNGRNKVQAFAVARAQGKDILHSPPEGKRQ